MNMAKAGEHQSRRKRNIKCLAVIAAGVIIQAVIILVFVLTVMKIRNPKVRLGGVTVETLMVNSSSTPLFSMKLNAQVTVKNTNFGHFKFQDTIATIFYRGTPVGEGTIGKARARARSTTRFNVTMMVGSDMVSKDSHLRNDVKSEKITLTSHAKLNGKVHLFKVIKKRKSPEMNCTMDVNTRTHEIQNLNCK